jgi:hypothetical protein
VSWWWLVPLGVAAGAAAGLAAMVGKLRAETEALVRATAELGRGHPRDTEK